MNGFFNKKIILLSIFLAPHFLFAADKADSLRKVLSVSKDDNGRIFNMYSLFIEYKNNNEDSARSYAKRILKFSDEKGNKLGLAKGNNAMAILFINASEYDSALVYLDRSLNFYKQAGSKAGVTDCYNNIAIVHDYKGDLSKAVEDHLLSLGMAEGSKDSFAISRSCNNIGTIYFQQNRFKDALDYFLRAFKIRERLADPYDLASSCLNLESVYGKLNEQELALKFQSMAVHFAEQTNDNGMLADVYSNLANEKSESKDVAGAIALYDKSIKLYTEMGDKRGVSEVMDAKGTALINADKIDEAITVLKSSLTFAKEANYLEGISATYKDLGEAFTAKKDYKNALDNFRGYLSAKDSLLNMDNNRQIAEMRTKYDSDKKEKDLTVKNLELNKKEAEVKQQSIYIFVSLGGILLMMILAFFIFRSYSQKKKANVELEHKNKVIEEKSRQIDDSIHYALSIQRAMLPDPAAINKIFPDCFGLFKPKDVVSGDFYWFTQKRGKTFIAAVDCTGHGVPGGFMSMLGNDKLHDAVEKGFTSPAEILMSLNVGVKKALKQNTGESASRDGMDISLLVFNEEKTKVEYSGANRPLWIFRNEKLIEYKPTKAAIGGFTPYDQLFEDHQIEIQKGDTLYIFSDGYADLFGGEKGKKFTTRRFRELLLSIQDKKMDEQEKILEKQMHDWQHGIEQIDDVLVIGIRI